METVDFEESGDVAWLYLNRPRRLNAVNDQLVTDLCAALDEAARRRSAAVVLAGRGSSFCAGADLKEDNSGKTSADKLAELQRIQDVTRKVRNGPFIVIAAVHGYALGAGCEFALCSDLIVAARDAIFGFPEVAVGLGVTGGISHVLPLAVGLARAKELVLTGRRITAEEAAAMGLINRVVEADQLQVTVQEMARGIVASPRQALLSAKQVLDRGPQGDLEAALSLEIATTQALMGSADALQAASSFQKGKGAR